PLAPLFASGRELPQHIVEDAAVHIIFDLVRCIDAAERVEREGRAVGARNIDGYGLARLEVRDAGDREDIVARQTQRLARLAVLELQREHPHADEVRAMDALKALDDHRADAEEVRALRRPVA